MNSKKGRIILALCFLLGVGSLVSIVALMRSRALSQDQGTATLTLISRGYSTAHELSGFSGRPMLLIFGDKSNPKWDEFLLALEADAQMASLLKESFVGVFIDLPNEQDVASTYDAKEEGTILVKDIHGPIWGALQAGAAIKEIKAMLSEIASSMIIEKSPMYADILARGSVVLDEMVQNGESDAAGKALSNLRKFEASSSSVLSNCEATASRLGIQAK